MNTPPIALVGWELGAGRGHVELMLPLVHALLKRGWRVVAAMRDVAVAHTAFARLDPATLERFELRQAPIFLHFATRPPRPLFSLAEGLAHSGFADAMIWGPVVGAWGRMIDDVQPDVVLADSAPSLVLAARSRVPIVMTGNGWTLPPDSDVVPPLPLRGYDLGRAMIAESAICKAANTIWRGSKHLGRFVDLLRGDENFIFGHPLLDPYRAYRNEPVWWLPNLKVLPAKITKTRRVIAYLPRSHPAQTNLLAALNTLSFKAVVYFGGNESADGNKVVVSATPLDFPHMLPSAACAVHHGGLGITSWCLAYGVPQVLMPTDLEKHLNAAAVSATDHGVVIPPNAETPIVAAAIRRTLTLATNMPAAFDPLETIRAVTAACTSYL